MFIYQESYPQVSNHIIYNLLIFSVRITYPAHPILFDFDTPIIFDDDPLYAIFSSPQYFLLCRPTHLAQHLVLSPPMCFYPNVRDNVSHLYKKHQLPVTSTNIFFFHFKFCDTNLQSFVIYHIRAVLPAPPNRPYFHFFSRVQRLDTTL